MDNGDTIPCLNEPWTFGGAKLMEWLAGFGMIFVVQGLFISNIGANMPILLLSWFGTTFGMAAVRKLYPDEERGVANAGLTAMGIHPPKIPSPAPLQPMWSGCPIRELSPTCDYMLLHIDDVLTFPDDDLEDLQADDLHAKEEN